MTGSVVDPMDRDMRQVLKHLPGRGLGHHSPGRPVKGLLGLPHLVLEEHVDQGGQKKDHPQGLQPHQLFVAYITIYFFHFTIPSDIFHCTYPSYA